MADLEKRILETPKLPNHIQGDGRYLMSLLKSFLEQTAEQINLANGFSAEDIQADKEGAVQTPRNFFLSFTRLGGEFNWSHINDVDTLAYYELRTDTNIGNSLGLLERTRDNRSTKMSVNATDKVYLYAFNLDGEYSNPAEISYNKPRPDAPKDISITKSTDGNLVSFSEIPTNCIGAHIYIQGTVYTAYDNIYLIQGELGSGNVESIEVAFFDNFGDGEAGYLYLSLPDVTGLLVERNGSELDFYWDAINHYNAKYVVKACTELSWEKGIELFRTATNDKNRILYPNSGTYYLMVKAYDEYGNYSANAAYQIMTTPIEIERNIILEIDQSDTMYSGNKINVYYDPVVGGVTLDRESMVGEYLFDVSLDKKYRARNWLESNIAVFVTENATVWEDAITLWGEADTPWGGIIGDDDGVFVKKQISTYAGGSDEDVFIARLNGNLETENNESPVVSIGADDFRNGRWVRGLYMSQATKLVYDIADCNETFAFTFDLKITQSLPTTILFTLETEDGQWLRLEYWSQSNVLKLVGSDGKSVSVVCFYEWMLQTTERPRFADSNYAWYESLSTFESIHESGTILDWLTFGVVQTEDKRKLYLYSYSKQKGLQGEIDAIPIGSFSKLYCHHKI